ncbi:cob(I)yrinic acid a,c-diamide adenosyltransferase [Clostridium intestinale]|uniref:cob(I)yrinic acid a,c-diamide adenosyltransferase n=1 Tax=Clostridium intestinale TaxID=36845 RepID=UPI0028EE9628|nr:cob(I)yrinic acid a,c-diamide adenosyltransferase [Clostridium intestinale]
MKLDKGMIQVYTGDGKGKTTAAIGQGIRAYGNGLKIVMIQFLKSNETGELNVLKNLGENFKLVRLEKKRGFVWTLKAEEIEELKKEVIEEYNYAKEVLANDLCDVLILDEVMGVLKNNFLSEDDVLELIKSKQNHVEVILTGRNVPEKVAGYADLITEMKEVKHYFSKGVNARRGIEY